MATPRAAGRRSCRPRAAGRRRSPRHGPRRRPRRSRASPTVATNWSTRAATAMCAAAAAAATSAGHRTADREGSVRGSMPLSPGSRCSPSSRWPRRRRPVSVGGRGLGVGTRQLLVQQARQPPELVLRRAVQVADPRRLHGGLLLEAPGLGGGLRADLLGLPLGGPQLLLGTPPRRGLDALGVAGRACAHLRGLTLGEAQQLLGPEAEAVLRRRVDVVVLRGLLHAHRGLGGGTGRGAARQLLPQLGVLRQELLDVLVDLDAVVAAQHHVEVRTLGLGTALAGDRRRVRGIPALTCHNGL